MDIVKVLNNRKIEVSQATITEAKKQLDHLRFKTLEITPEEDFICMLAKSLESKTPLRVKCGIDPTGSDVHLGHTIPYRKMRQFQDLGHTGVVIIGDYTAQIGDPTGKVESRPSLSSEEVKINSEKYLEQVYFIVDKEKTEVRFQSEWFEKVNLLEIMNWAHQTTVAKLISHDTFKNRLEQGQSLGLHEMFYPVLQGMDSVFVKADVELGGSDQKFNVLMGRDYQRHQNLRPQVAMLLPIINGTCGSQKMSKSLNNYIGIFDEPFDKFGKVMSIPDASMDEYAHFASTFNHDQYVSFKKGLESGELHPNIAKKELAENIVSIFHGEDVAKQMRTQFEEVFKKKKVPDNISEITLGGSQKLIDVLASSGEFKSNGEIRRMIKQNAVGIVEGDKLTDPDLMVDDSYKEKIIKVGKRKFFKLV